MNTCSVVRYSPSLDWPLPEPPPLWRRLVLTEPNSDTLLPPASGRAFCPGVTSVFLKSTMPSAAMLSFMALPASLASSIDEYLL